MTAEIVGAVHDRDLLDALFNGRAELADPLAQHMGPPLPLVGAGEPVSVAASALGGAGAALVHVEGKPAAILTRQDLLAFFAARG